MNKYLKVLKDIEVFPNNTSKKPRKYETRHTVKAIVLNKKSQIAFVTNKVHKLYTLPGGGTESKNLKLEITRECEEEINQKVKIVKEIGKIQEFRNRNAKKYITTCYLAHAIKKTKTDRRTNEEKLNGVTVKWIKTSEIQNIFEEQSKNLKKGKIKFYNTAFNIVRDKIFIDKWLETQ